MIGVGFAQGDAIGKTAKRYPKTKFAIIDSRPGFVPGKPKNVQGLLFREEEVGLSRRLPRRAAGEGAQGARLDLRRRRLQGTPRRPLHRGLQGGCGEGVARHHRPLELLPGLGRPGQVQGARAQPDRRRLGRRLPGRGRLRARRAERGQGARPLGIGVDADQSFLGKHILTSAEKGVDAAVFLTIQSVAGRHVEGRRRLELRPQGRGRRPRQGQPARPGRGHRRERKDQARDRRRPDQGHPEDVGKS